MKVESNQYLFDIFKDDVLIQTFLRHMSNDFVDIVEHNLWFLTHVVSDHAEIRDQILKSQIFDHCIKTLKQKEINLELLRNLIWFLCNVCKSTETVPPEEKLKDLVLYFSSFLYTHDNQILSNCLWGLYYVTQFDENYPNIYNKVVDSGAVVKILKFDYSKMQLCILPSLRVLGNLLSGKYDVVDVSL